MMLTNHAPVPERWKRDLLGFVWFDNRYPQMWSPNGWQPMRILNGEARINGMVVTPYGYAFDVATAAGDGLSVAFGYWYRTCGPVITDASFYALMRPTATSTMHYGRVYSDTDIQSMRIWRETTTSYEVYYGLDQSVISSVANNTNKWDSVLIQDDAAGRVNSTPTMHRHLDGSYEKKVGGPIGEGPDWTRGGRHGSTIDSVGSSSNGNNPCEGQICAVGFWARRMSDGEASELTGSLVNYQRFVSRNVHLPPTFRRVLPRRR